MGQRCSCQRLAAKCNINDAHHSGSMVEQPESRAKEMPANQVIDYLGIHRPPDETQSYSDFTTYRRSMLWKAVIFMFAFATEVMHALPEQSAEWVERMEACRTAIFVLLTVDYMLCALAKGFVLAVATGWTSQSLNEAFIPHHHFNLQFQNMLFGVWVFLGVFVMKLLVVPAVTEDEHFGSAFVMSIDLFMIFHHGLVVYVGRT